MAINLRQSEHGADFPGETFLALKEEEIKKDCLENTHAANGNAYSTFSCFAVSSRHDISAAKYLQRRAMKFTIQVRERGVVTLPAGLREKNHIENGKIFQLVDLDGIFVFVPMGQ